VLLTEIFVFALFAASLHFLVGPAGMTSFGHAAYFGLGAYAAGLLVLRAHLPMELAVLLAPVVPLAAAALFGWFSARLSGIYFAMLTLAFAQIVWSLAHQWDELTGGSNGLIGLWPSAWLSSRAAYYWMTLLLCGGAIACLWRALFSPFGYALRAGRDSPQRADAIGIDTRRLQWAALRAAGLLAGLAGALFAFSKGSISPEVLAVPRSVDGLVMVLLGGLQSVTGPILGAAILIWLQDELARDFAYWRAAMGAVILALVLAFPGGLSSIVRRR
jgi:branched-chain amino acid transport system permease protein